MGVVPSRDSRTYWWPAPTHLHLQQPHHVGGQLRDGAAHPHHEQDAGRVHPAGGVQQHRPATDCCGRWTVSRKIISFGELCWKRFPSSWVGHCDKEASDSPADQWTNRVRGVLAL